MSERERRSAQAETVATQREAAAECVGFAGEDGGEAVARAKVIECGVDALAAEVETGFVLGEEEALLLPVHCHAQATEPDADEAHEAAVFVEEALEKRDRALDEHARRRTRRG